MVICPTSRLDGSGKQCFYSHFFSAVFGGVLLSMVTCQVKLSLFIFQTNFQGLVAFLSLSPFSKPTFRVSWPFLWEWWLSSSGLSHFYNVLSHQAIIGVSAKLINVFIFLPFAYMNHFYHKPEWTNQRPENKLHLFLLDLEKSFLCLVLVNCVDRFFPFFLRLPYCSYVKHIWRRKTFWFCASWPTSFGAIR